MKLVDISVNKPILMTMVVMSAVVLGLFSLKDLGVDLLPEIAFPVVTVRTIYPGAGPQEIESLVTEKIEDAVSSVSGIKNVLSTSMENVSVVIIEFELGTSVDVAANEVKDKVDAIKFTLPDDAEDPVIVKVDINATPVIQLAVNGDRPLEEIYEIVNDMIVDEINRVQGVASVDVVGGKEREILISVDRKKLDAFGISINQIIKAVASGNIELPSGKIKLERKEYTLRLKGEYDSIEEINEIIIPSTTGKNIRIKDVARVIDSFKEQRQLVRYNGQSGVGVFIIKKSDANIVETAHGVNNQIETLKKRLPPDIEVATMIDNSIFIESSIKDLVMNIILGSLLTAFLLYIFLHSLKGVLIVGISIPTSIISSFILIKYAGFTINFMSLMALAISIGILVTNAIVVLENIQNHIDRGDKPKEAAKSGTKEIAIAVLASTLTNIVVFTPIAFMKGIVGQFFIQFGLTVTFATIFSLVTAFTLTPMLASRLLAKTSHKENILTKFSKAWERFYVKLANIYRSAVGYVLKKRVVTILIIIVIFFGTMLGLARYLDLGFFTKSDQGYFVIKVDMPVGVNIDQTDEALYRIENILKRHRNIIKSVYTVLGKTTGSIFSGSTEGVDVAEILIDIGDKENRDISVKNFSESIREELVLAVPSATIGLLDKNPAGGDAAPVQLQILGIETEHIVEMSEKAKNILKGFKNLVDIESSWEVGKPEIIILPNRKVISEFGITVSQIALVLRFSIDGNVATQYRVGKDEYDIRVRFSDSDKNNINNLKQITFLTPVGKVPLSELCQITEGKGPLQINRKNKAKMITVSANLGSGAIGNTVAEIREKLDELNWPVGTEYFFAGEEERRAESTDEIGQALLLSIILTYMLLAAILESFVEPIMIMSTVPLALIGVIFGLILTNQQLDIFSMMAVVMLVGIVVNNAILILDYIHTLRTAGYKLLEAVLTSCQTRLRPIIMTNAAVSLAMVPLALGIGEGAEMRAPMAIVSISGIITSTVFTLFLLPILYFTYENWKENRKANNNFKSIKQ
ncbi:MAG: hypothetical protein DRQ13_05665 [Ignavibacteriae bacterium]|nr:MAG: hypothetical protein DRQ13_05665 [Ignavibacteriota bacterium]